MLDNRTLSELRYIALDEKGASSAKRLAAIDAIASAGNFWGTRRTPVTQYVEPTKRGRLFLVKALRLLFKTNKHTYEGTQTAVKTRLLFLKGIGLGKGLHRLEPSDGQNRPVAKPVARVPDVVSDIEKFLTEHGG